MKLFAQIRKVDEEKRLVYGRAVQEVVDRVNEIFDYASSKPHFEAWAKSFNDATDGKSQGNIRAMHGKVSAGIVKQIDFSDTEKAIDIAAHINDDQEWRKVLDGNYTGFSIGGSYVGDKITEKIDDVEVRRYTANPSEISIVDSPCIPTARFFEVVKVGGAVEKVDFKPAPIEVKGTDDEVAELGRSLNDSGMTLRSVLDLLSVENMYVTAEDMEKREFSADERKQAAKEGAALPDGSFPIKTKGDLANAIKAYGRAKDKAAAKAHIIKRAKALGASDTLPASWTKSDKAADGDLKKGLYAVTNLGECLSCLGQVCASAQDDFEYEGDNSPVPMKLRNIFADMVEVFKEMADEESAEMLASLKTSAGVGEDDEIEQAVEAAVRVGALRKVLLDPESSLDAVLKIAKEYEEPVTTAALGNMKEFAAKIIAKAGARHSKVDAAHLQEAHDHLVGMGASCGEGEKVAPSGDLKKAADAKDAIIEKLQADVNRLLAQPMPHVITLRAVRKDDEQETRQDQDELAKMPYDKLVKLADGRVDWDASAKLLNKGAA